VLAKSGREEDGIDAVWDGGVSRLEPETAKRGRGE
jgi:hypothetical protein